MVLPMRLVREAGVGRVASYGILILVSLTGLAALLHFGGGSGRIAAATGSVQVAGSESMRPVVTACAESFMAKNPKANVIVRGGGSGDGIAALLHGLIDVGMTSRDLSKRERDYALSKAIEISEFPLALDGIAIVVNQTNPVAELSLAQIQAVFAGRVRNWRELHGEDREIQVFGRSAGSGTATLFAERIGGEAPYAASVENLPTNEAIVAEVAARAGAIGYTGLGALTGARDRIKAISLRDSQQSAAAAATPEAIRSGRYPLARILRFATAREVSSTSKAFLDFCLGASGQALVHRAGYVGMNSHGR
jgi:phosphate transport system substrate-binding protein